MQTRTWSSGAYRFGFNGQEKDDEVAGEGSINTARYWMYDTRVSRRWNLDPKPQIFISDYVCFGDNPLWFKDPHGDDKYKVDKDGNISLKRKTNKKYDKLVGAGKLFNKSIKIEKGILKSKIEGSEPRQTLDGLIDIKYDAYHGLSKSQGEKIFKFLAKTTSVEWTLYELGTGKLSTSSLSTSHATNSEAGATGLLKDNVFLLSITRISHIHPGESKTPSGSWFPLDEPQFRTGDVGHAKWVEDNITDIEKNVNTLNIISNNPTQTHIRPIFRIYTANDNSYTTYDKNTYIDPGFQASPKNK